MKWIRFLGIFLLLFISCIAYYFQIISYHSLWIINLILSFIFYYFLACYYIKKVKHHKLVIAIILCLLAILLRCMFAFTYVSLSLFILKLLILVMMIVFHHKQSLNAHML